MTTPTEKDIAAAKDYLRRRLQAERSMTLCLESAMREAARQIVSLCYSAGTAPGRFSYDKLPRRVRREIDEVIERLALSIDDYYTTFGISDNYDEEKNLLPVLLGEDGGPSYQERLEQYCSGFKDELIVLVGAGIALGIGQEVLARSIGDNLRKPYANPLLADGMETTLTYGRGRTNSMFTALGTLTRHGIAKAWMRHWEDGTRKDGAIGWVVMRGSSYPCGMCDDNCGFHWADDGTSLPRHPNCCCFAVPVKL